MKLWGGRVVAVVGVALVAVLLLLSRPADPVYQGKRLSEYLASYQFQGIAYIKDLGGPSCLDLVGWYPDPTATEAISAVGTNAFPLLVEMLQTRGYTSKVDAWLRGLAARHGFFRSFTRRSASEAEQRQRQAAACFQTLGPKAAGAIPMLIPLLQDPDSAKWAIMSLRYIRPARPWDILSLTKVFSILRLDRNGRGPAETRIMAVLALATFGTNASGAAPLLLNCLDSMDATLAGCAALALASVGAPADRVLPLLLDRISAAKPPPRADHQWSGTTTFSPLDRPRPPPGPALALHISAIGQYGCLASNALPVLKRLLDLPEEMREVQLAAWRAILRINLDIEMHRTDAVPTE